MRTVSPLTQAPWPKARRRILGLLLTNPDRDITDACRRKRNLLSYERVGLATEPDVEELQKVTERLRAQVERWLRDNHPELLGSQ